ncbi:carboxysome shell carbonic anhydrase [Acidithiobacillus marinus]|uniref:Carboxysome shell carbonic anhydrase n=1 Tax=Acidithiobacillus marinus TaxID=187490 RepID=A0A2I1DKF5_9PROT|nr:carboxysome shell carbonic anhydrase [Acidithiobacillus marinus]PKY10360.1 carboxysome shell carbonic anhydrase [Acidithiobacillus marinus]
MDTRKIRRLRGGPGGQTVPMARQFAEVERIQVPLQADGQAAVHPACASLPDRQCHHPLANITENARLARCENTIKERFDEIVPVLKDVAALSGLRDFTEQANRLAEQRLGHVFPTAVLENSWIRGVNIPMLYSSSVFAALVAGVEQFSQRIHQEQADGQSLDALLVDCGFHAVNVSACADGRLKGLFPYILRLPASNLLRRSAFAGTLFDVESDILDWQAAELRRFREGYPSTSDSGTRYLKVAVYHGSSLDPTHQGCAAHHSNEKVAMEAALERLNQFRQGIENAFCCGASTDILLIGLDTDTDAIRIHVPDSRGDLSLFRFVDNAEIYKNTLGMNADQARLAIYEAIENASDVGGWGQGEGKPHDGMRRLIANLLINNLSQIEYVAENYGGWYPDKGHGERFISIGDGFQELQVRNLAYFARLDTVEEGAADLDVGVKIFRHLNVEQGLPIPMAIHYYYDANVPGHKERVIAKLQRVSGAIRVRYAELLSAGMLFLHGSIQNHQLGSPLEEVSLP